MPALFLFKAAIHRQLTLNERENYLFLLPLVIPPYRKQFLKFQPQGNKQNHTKNII